MDDDAGFRESLHAIASSLGIDCLSLESLEDLKALPSLARPACLVLDHSLGGGTTGVEAMRFLVGKFWNIPTIVCTAYGTIPLAVEYLRAGAMTFVEKPLQGRQMAAEILDALDQDTRALEDESTYLQMRGCFESMSPRQKRIVGLISQGVIHKQIADQLDVSRRTVDIEKSYIFQTLRVESQVELGMWIARLLTLDHAWHRKGGLENLSVLYPDFAYAKTQSRPHFQPTMENQTTS